MICNSIEDNDKISVIMGAYNCEEYISEAIESIIQQTYENWELLICDDGSSDNTYQIAKSYQEQNPEKIKVLKNESNCSLAFALNHCLQYATGQYIARMDADDISDVSRFEKQIAYLHEHTNVQLVGTAMQWFDDVHGKTKVVFCPEHVEDKTIMHRCIPFNHATIMTYKKVYDALGGYNVSERTRRCEDAELWYRFFAAGYIGGNIHEALYYVRENQDAIKRRTFKSRWNAFAVTKNGYDLLGYPKRWIIKPFLETLFKSFTPYYIYVAIREIEKGSEG